jgi:peroxiredoxin
MLEIGDKVPDFTLAVGYADGRREATRFSALLGKGPIVLEFFPLAFTRVCTTQMCDVRDNIGAFRSKDAQVFGFSVDTAPSNAAFAKSLELPHGIFSDPNREVADVLWATEDVIGVRKVCVRGWMVVSPDGTVAAKYVATQAGAPWVGTKPVEEALARLARAG